MDYLLNISNSRNNQRTLKESRYFRKKTKTKAVISQRKHRCAFCNSLNSAYTCSQCDKHYCSSSCFSSELHKECSEIFFKKCVFEHMKNKRIGKDERDKITEILKKNIDAQDQDALNLLDALEEDDDYDQNGLENLDIDIMKDPRLLEFTEELIKKLNGLEIENSLEIELDKLWDEMSHDEQSRFVELVNCNSKLFDKVIIDWTPWWRDERWKCAVQDITSDKSDKQIDLIDTEKVIQKDLCQFPVLFTGLEHVNKLTSKTPSHSLIFSLINLSYAYAHLVKLYNGEIVVSSESEIDNCHIWTNDIFDVLLKHAPVLSKDSCIDFKNCFETVQFCVNQTLTHNDGQIVKSKDKIHAIELLDDVQLFFEMKHTNVMTINDGNDKTRKLPKNLIYLLSDTINILCNIVKFDKKITKKKSKNIELARRKVFFYLCWLLDYGEDVLFKNSQQLSNAIQLVCEQLKKEVGMFEKVEEDIEYEPI